MSHSSNSNENRTVVSVSDLTTTARQLLERNFPLVYVAGEISNFAAPRSGHWYFTLKDEKAQVRSAMFKNRNMRIRFRPKDGDQVIVRGRLSLFEPRGDFQLIAEHIEEAGDGALLRAFEQLRDRLQAEGLFSAERKQPIPAMPRQVAVITSPHGAAIHDVLTVMRRRFPATRIMVLPVQVQGSDAPPQIVKALQTAGARTDVDVVLVTRGGGSLEDLWSFNAEMVARAIAACPIPVVSAVGHESDVTIADFVADLRAPTPSAAAELLTQDAGDWQARFDRAEQRLVSSLSRHLENSAQRLDYMTRRLRHPGDRTALLKSRLSALHARLQAGMTAAMPGARLQRAGSRLERQMMQALENLPRTRVQQLDQKLKQQVTGKLQDARLRMERAVTGLEARSPLGVLSRGYAIVTDADGHVVTASGRLKPGDSIAARLHEGTVNAVVSNTDSEQEEN